MILTDVHITDADGEVLYPRARTCSLTPETIQLLDKKGGMIARALIDASKWLVPEGFATSIQIAGGNTRARPPSNEGTAIIEVSSVGKLGMVSSIVEGNTIARARITDTAGAPSPGNTADEARFNTLLSVKLTKNAKASLDERARELKLTTGALVRDLIASHQAVSGTHAPVQSEMTPAIPVVGAMHSDPLIINAVDSFKEAAAGTCELLIDFPEAAGISKVVAEFRHAYKMLGTLHGCTRSRSAVLNIMVAVHRIMKPACLALTAMRTAVPASRERINEVARHLRASRAQLRELSELCADGKW